jgi:hypothetical protein
VLARQTLHDQRVGNEETALDLEPHQKLLGVTPKPPLHRLHESGLGHAGVIARQGAEFVEREIAHAKAD